MRSVTLRLEDLRTTILNLGFVGENEHKQFRFDSKKMFDEYPGAAASLTVVPQAGEAYPAIVERDGDFVIWTITDSNLTAEGDGEIQLAFTSGEVVAKTYIGRTRTCRALMPTGEIPEGIDDFLTRAGAALTAIPETINEALAEAKASGEFDGPAGPAGQDGADGQDGFSPTATVVKSGKTATITITDKNGTTTAQVSDGEGGGTSDYSDLTNKPQIAGVTLSGNKSLAELGADPTSIIDDTAGDGDTDKVWSADKSSELLSEINTLDGIVYSEATLSTDSQSEGWRLNESDGLCSNNSSYKLVKYKITAGEVLHIVSDDRFQFQSSSGVPSSGTNNNRIGDTYQNGTFNLTVPNNATYLVVSTLKTNSGASVKVIQTIKEEIDTLRPDASNGDIGKFLKVKTVENGKVVEYEFGSGGSGGVVEETVSGSTPSITGVADHRYICGECATLSIVAPVSGCIDVIFESGSTATVLTVSSSIKWTNDFNPSSLETNATYELNILNGELGVAGKWT